MILEDKKMIDYISTGAEAKILQYEEMATNISDDKIDLINLLGGNQNCLLINMEKDAQRYHQSLTQFEKVGIRKFVHLKGTNGRSLDKSPMEMDLTYIINFLSQFNKGISPIEIKINQFSEINDPNVNIQDGPLGCYCSHLRAMIYGYQNFEDYTIICEDDISITNTENIQKYITQIPDDWDIICLNSMPKNKEYCQPFYKFESDFHSCHFYIIRNKSLPQIFRGMYPIVDQVDVLVSNLHNDLNIYNISDTVYQKNIKTNTQNNLHVIFTSPNYKLVRQSLSETESLLNHFANLILPDNNINNQKIVKSIMYDVIYNFILTDGVNNQPSDTIENWIFDNPYKDSMEFDLLKTSIGFFIQCSKKGVNPKLTGLNLANICLFTLTKFDLHNSDTKAIGFGSTAHTYRESDKVIKKYNNRLRWACEGHDNPTEIIIREIGILTHIQDLGISPKLVSFDDWTIIMSYCGESLYDNFNLPSDWESQIRNIFNLLDGKRVFYPEFRLQNILVMDDKIRFVDFGMASIKSDCDNRENCDKFIKYLQILEDRFKSTNDIDTRHRLISTLLINIS
jgi:GR25 family glycosyltransferase involved in LPS biosynthesis/tRNA A-37 threonylcarbamoyl transferase component Bud32